MFHQYNSMAGENERESWDKQEARSVTSRKRAAPGSREPRAERRADPKEGPQAPKRTAVRNKKRLIRSGCCG